jgi:hypothetical protein
MWSEAFPFCIFLACMIGHSFVYFLTTDQNVKDMFFISSITWMITCMSQLYYHILKLSYHPMRSRDEKIIIVLHVLGYILSFCWIIVMLIKLENNKITDVYEVVFISVATSLANMFIFIVPILKHKNGFMLMCGYNIAQTILNYAISIVCYYIMEKLIDGDFIILMYGLVMIGTIVMIAILYVRTTNPWLFDQEPSRVV